MCHGWHSTYYSNRKSLAIGQASSEQAFHWLPSICVIFSLADNPDSPQLAGSRQEDIDSFVKFVIQPVIQAEEHSFKKYFPSYLFIFLISVAEPKLFIFGSGYGSDFGHNFGSGSSSCYSHILALKTVLIILIIEVLMTFSSF